MSTPELLIVSAPSLPPPPPSSPSPLPSTSPSLTPPHALDQEMLLILNQAQSLSIPLLTEVSRQRTAIQQLSMSTSTISYDASGSSTSSGPSSQEDKARSSEWSRALQEASIALSSGVMKLSQHLQQCQHPLSKRFIVAVGASSGQIKAFDFEQSVSTCQRAMADLEQWPYLAGLSAKESMLIAFRGFKKQFTEAEAFTCRLLYVEFFLKLSALLEKEYPSWSVALSFSAQKGLKNTANEAIRSMTKITSQL